MSRAVIDQPGLRVLTVGLIFAIALGFGLRSQISSAHVEASLQKSLQILGKDFLIDFDVAEVRLSKWGLPLPHLIIEKLRMSPKKKLCQSSQIYIDELELPLQIKNIFSREKSIDFIRANNVEVRLVDIDACLAKSKKLEGGAQPTERTSTSPTLFSQKTGTRLKEIAIDQLKIISLKNYDQPVVFKQLKCLLDYENERLSQIDIKSRLYSIKDRHTDIYFLISDLKAQVKPDSEQNIEMNLQVKGRLLDGDVQFFAKGSSQNQKLTYELTTKNVSIKAYGPLIKRNGRDIPLDRWPLSISFYMLGEAQWGSAAKASFKFKKFEALGENMLVQSPEVDVEAVNGRTEISPFQVRMNRIPLSPFKSIFSDQYDFQSVEKLGVISGIFDFEDPEHWKFDGGIQKTELVFSNRGSREIETIDSVSLGLQNTDDKLNFNLKDIIVQQEPIQGGLEGEYVKHPYLLQLKLDLEGPVLNEKIWKQLTQVSQNPSVKLNWNYKKITEERHQIRINAPELLFQGLHLDDVQIDFLQLTEDETRSVALSLKTAKAQVLVKELRPQVARHFFNEQTELSPENEYVALKPQVTLQGNDWKNMTFDFEMNLYDGEGLKILDRLKAKGEWSQAHSVSGTAQLQNAKRTLKYAIIKNSVDEIDFVPEKKSELSE